MNYSDTIYLVSYIPQIVLPEKQKIRDNVDVSKLNTRRAALLWKVNG